MSKIGGGMDSEEDGQASGGLDSGAVGRSIGEGVRGRVRESEGQLLSFLFFFWIFE